MERSIKARIGFYCLSFVSHIFVVGCLYLYTYFFFKADSLQTPLYSIEVIDNHTSSTKNILRAHGAHQSSFNGAHDINKSDVVGGKGSLGSNGIQIGSEKSMDQQGPLDGRVQGNHLNYKPPQLLKKNNIPYPEIAMKKRLDGYLIARLSISEQGSVTHVEYESSSDLDFATSDVLASLRLLEFLPAQLQGRAVESKIRYVHRFHLEK